MSVEKLKPIHDLLSEVLDEVEPVLTFTVGASEYQCWKPDHITEAHNLRYVNVQVELMVLGRQYQAIVEQLNNLSSQVEISTEDRIKINELTQGMNDKVKEMLPLNVAYIEAITETKQGTFLGILKDELKKRSPRKEVPVALFVNKLKEQIFKAMEEIDKEEELEETGKQVLLTPEAQKALPDKEPMSILEAA